MRFEWHLNGVVINTGSNGLASWKVGTVVASGIRNYRINGITVRADGVTVFDVKPTQTLR